MDQDFAQNYQSAYFFIFFHKYIYNEIFIIDWSQWK